jgi:ectoine hydroxylase-related dioxygenase (phytanoyl-CoA dioxygenase family)
MASIPRLSSKDSPSDIAAALARDGCVVVTGVTGDSQRAALARELGPWLESADPNMKLPFKYDTPDGPVDFYPGNTRRVTAMVARSETYRGFVTNPLILAVCGTILGPNCDRYQVHATAALVVGPGATAQVLHREEDPFRFLFTLPRPPLVVATMWAITDFTAANGGTLLVPGSHRWPADRTARPDEVVSAEMPAGSVLLWMGGTLHGAGANTSDQWRFGVFLSYSLGWLRQEENQYLDLPPELAMTIAKEARDLAGYEMHAALGYSDPRVLGEARKGR